MKPLVLRSAAVVVLVTAAVVAAAQVPKPASSGSLVTDLRIPGGVERLLGAAGVPGLTDPAVAIPAFIRAVYVLPDRPRTDIALLVDAMSGARGAPRAGEKAPGDTVPLPLTADWWSSVVLRRQVPAAQLAAAILGNRRAAFIYLGLLSVDDETLGYFSGHPAAIAGISDRAAGAFAQWGRSIRIERGTLQLPGGAAAAATWQEIVGESPSDPDRFIQALVSRDEGRAAYFFDAVTHLDRERQAFTLAAGAGSQRTDRAKAFYSVVSETKTILSGSDWPKVRHPFGPVAIVRQVRVDGDGRMRAPASRALWDAAIGGNAAACARASNSGPPADAAWLVDRIEREFLETRGHWVAAVAFAQRVFSNATPAEMPAVCESVNAFPRSDGLLLALERMGVQRPADYVTMLRFAQRTWSGADRRAAVIRTAQVQGILQVLQQAVSVRALSPLRARELVLSLAKNGDPTLPPGAVGRWLRSTLLAEACPGQSSADTCLVRLASGEGRPGGGGSAGVVEWEDDRYRVDLGAAPATRIERVRRAQRATRVDDALNVLDAAGLAAALQPSAADLDRAATIVKAVAPAVTLNGPTLFGHSVSPTRPTLEEALGGLAPSAPEAIRGVTATALLTSADLLLADALVSLAYAVAIGDPDDAVLMGGNPARRHLFDGAVGPATEAWHLPEEVQAMDRTWLVEGSVLVLRTVYARSWLRRLSLNDPGAAVHADLQDQRVFGETVTAFSPSGLSDEGRDLIVAAIRRGRRRIAELVASPRELWKAARETGLGEWRCRAALWAAGHGQERAAAYFSLAELMWLGVPEGTAEVVDAWGVATRPIDGGLGVRMPRTSTWEDYQGPSGVGQLATQMADVHLAVAEALFDLGLPAALAPDVAAQASWDVMAAARMAHRDDWFALVRAAQSLPRDRFLDYVSALTATGPLVPAR